MFADSGSTHQSSDKAPHRTTDILHRQKAAMQP